MNKRQNEVLQYLDNREKRVLKELEEQYRGALEDINMSIQVMLTDQQTPSKIYRIQHQKALRSQIEGIIERLHGKEYETIAEYLRDSYTDSFVGCMYDHAGQGIPLILPIDQNAAVKAIEIDSELSEDLYTSLGVDTQKLKKTIRQEITRGLASTMVFADISRNVANVAKAPMNRAKVIVKTEAHRIQEAARYDGMLRAKSKGAKEVKIWTSLGNSRVRDAHRELHGQIREVDEPFTYGTKKAMYPGDFGDPALDINCNCKALPKATWLLDEITLKELQEQAASWGLDKTKDFEEYKTKYLKAAEPLVNTGKIPYNSSAELHQKTNKARKHFKSLSKERFDQLTIPARKMGATIIQGTPEVEAHLAKNKAAAATLGDCLLFRSDATMCEVLEETRHFWQDKNGMNNDQDADLRTILNEIDAKEYVLLNAARFKLPRAEIELMQDHLAYYRNELEKYMKGGK